jgi:hypothetical protein
MAAWFLAASPIKRSSAEKATYDGVVRLPSIQGTKELTLLSPVKRKKKTDGRLQ